MKLQVVERIKLMQIIPFPKEGNRMAFKIIDDLIKNLSFTEEEFKKFKIKEVKNGDNIETHWEYSEFVEITIGEIASDIICESLSKIDNEGKLDIYLYQLSVKFDLDGYLNNKNIPEK